MLKSKKTELVEFCKEQLKVNKNFILTHYSGIKVADLTPLRRNIRSKGGLFKVVKNNMFRRALKEMNYAEIDDKITGPIGVVFSGDQVGEMAKVLSDFAKEKENFDYFLSVIDGTVFDKVATRKLASLPSKEVLLSQIMSLINGPARGIAVGTNQIMASLARGINAVAEKNNG